MHSQGVKKEAEDPSTIDAVTDAVKKHPNLVHLGVDRDCRELLYIGLQKGGFQKAGVREVDAIKSRGFWNSGLPATMSSKCECMLVCVKSCSGLRSLCIYLYAFSYQG